MLVKEIFSILFLHQFHSIPVAHVNTALRQIAKRDKKNAATNFKKALTLNPPMLQKPIQKSFEAVGNNVIAASRIW